MSVFCSFKANVLRFSNQLFDEFLHGIRNTLKDDKKIGFDFSFLSLFPFGRKLSFLSALEQSVFYFLRNFTAQKKFSVEYFSSICKQIIQPLTIFPNISILDDLLSSGYASV